MKQHKWQNESFNMNLGDNTFESPPSIPSFISDDTLESNSWTVEATVYVKSVFEKACHLRWKFHEFTN